MPRMYGRAVPDAVARMQNDRPRMLGLDYGSRTIGVALSDQGAKIALGLTTIRRSEEAALRKSISQLKEIIAQYGVSAVILGFPKNMNNTQGPRCEKTLEFKEKLEKNLGQIPIILWDERLSTAEAMRTLSPGAKTKIDETAAVLILQGYLDSMQRSASSDGFLESVIYETESEADCLMNEESPFAGNPEDSPVENEAVAFGGDESLYEILATKEDDNILVLREDDGATVRYEILATKEDQGTTYLLTAELADGNDNLDDDGEEHAVVIFRCTDAGHNEFVLEYMYEEDFEDFDRIVSLFEDEFESLGIIVDE